MKLLFTSAESQLPSIYPRKLGADFLLLKKLLWSICFSMPLPLETGFCPTRHHLKCSQFLSCPVLDMQMNYPSLSRVCGSTHVVPYDIVECSCNFRHCSWFSLFGLTRPTGYCVASLHAGPTCCISYNMYLLKHHWSLRGRSTIT